MKQVAGPPAPAPLLLVLCKLPLSHGLSCPTSAVAQPWGLPGDLCPCGALRVVVEEGLLLLSSRGKPRCLEVTGGGPWHPEGGVGG